ncbi:MAG TPA: electron transport complex subunit RsxA [bacterium]|nr:electron transport complex subunit RsxA [bacterium]
MSQAGELILIIIGAVFVNNFVLSRFLGICPFVGVSKKVESAIGMGMAVTFVMLLASTASWLIYEFILLPLSLTYLRTIVFILVIASLVQFVEMVIQKASPSLYKSLGVYLPLITTNCAVLGLAILNIDEGYNLIQTVFHSIGAALGFTLAMVLMAGIRERLDRADVPESLKGAPIAFIVAGLLAIAFMGFAGLL